MADALWGRALEVAREDEAYDAERVAALARTAFGPAAGAGEAPGRLGRLPAARGAAREAEPVPGGGRRGG